MISLFVKSSAVFSADSRFRLTLTRIWDESLPVIAWCGLNPSVAGADSDDPTIRREVDFSRRFGFGGLVKTNLYALVTPYPAELCKGGDPVGFGNDEAIAEATRDRELIVAWGAAERYAKDRIKHVLELLGDRPLKCLGTTASGQPRHPLYLPSETQLQPFNPGGAR